MNKPKQISAVIGIGSAINYTLDVYNEKLTAAQRGFWKNALDSSGAFYISSPYLDAAYPFTQELYHSGNEYLIQHCNTSTFMTKKGLSCPVRFLHGDNDDIVHVEKVYEIADLLRTEHPGTDITIKLIEGGDHRLSKENEISAILNTLDEFV